MKLTVRPISDRTPFTSEHRESNFGVTYSQMRDLLDRELWFLDAVNPVLELDVQEHHIRNDGDIRAGANIATPAVRLAFDSNQGPLIYATDAFVRRTYKRGVMEKDWHHNLYAIAKALEALRLVDRYGVTGRGEQYTGFKALGGGIAMPAGPPPMSRQDAVYLLDEYADQDWGLDADGPRIFKLARRATHPDFGHPRDQWDRVEQAGRVLGLIQ